MHSGPSFCERMLFPKDFVNNLPGNILRQKRQPALPRRPTLPEGTKKAEPKPRLLVTISRDYFLAGSPFTFSTSRMIQ